MHIAIIGGGNVGAALGRVWAGAGHRVTYGVRDPNAADHAGLRLHADLLRPREAALAADILVLATPWSAAVEVVRDLGDLAGRTLVDLTNAVRFGGPIVERALAGDESGAELIQAAAPSTRVVKAFNQYGLEVLGGAARFATPPVLFMAGDVDAAKAPVAALARDAGFAPIDAGPLRAARLLEDAARLWMTLAVNTDLGRAFSFAVQTTP